MTATAPMLAIQKALTLTAPWGTLCVARRTEIPDAPPHKRHETRSWPLAKRWLPLRIAVHQGKGHTGLRSSLIYEGVFDEPYRMALISTGHRELDPWGDGTWHGDDGRKPLPLGAIVGLVTITECIRTEEAKRQYQLGRFDVMDYSLGNYTPGRWAWVLEDPVELPQPIPCRGFQQIWSLPPAIAEQLQAFDQSRGADHG